VKAQAGAKGIGLELRAGVHTGEVEVRGDDLGGLAVTIAKRACDLAAPGQVLVTRTVTDHVVGSGIKFEDRATTNSRASQEPGGSTR
jgi:class 3 adenylate cyclase